jgi:ribonuclease J
MRITIHRGTDQIGGCVTEYEHEGWRLFVDYGEQLPGAKHTEPLDVEGLTKGDLSKSALLVTHYHGDHIGCITRIPDEVPMYIGKVGRDIQLVLSNHLMSVDNLQKDIIAKLEKAISFDPGVPFSFGLFRITPIIIDHSAFDAYAFKIEADGKKAFHTGDFRTHGFRSGNLPKVINTYVGHVDYVVCEATNVSRPDVTSKTEHDLQKEFEKMFKEHKNNIVYVSTTNIDRIFSLYHAALRVGRPFYVDKYQKEVMDVVTQRNSIWGKSSLYRYGKYEPVVLQYENGEFRMNDKFSEHLELKGYVLLARASEKYSHLIEQIPGEKVKYLSMWKGYVDKECVAFNPILAGALGSDFEYLHTSGHCDMQGMNQFFKLLNPEIIIPIHTDNPDKFIELFGNEWNVLRLHDGEKTETKLTER